MEAKHDVISVGLATAGGFGARIQSLGLRKA